MIDLRQGDCFELLRDFPSCSVEAVVTDPPAGIALMGMAWDRDKGGRDAWVAWLHGIMEECFRVLKPGGHALVWALPRTSHWTATAVEDAGFEIRDVVMHLFGTGFPQSHDVSKAIDREAGATRDSVRVPASECRNPKASGAGRDGAPGATRPWIERALRVGYHEKSSDTPATAEAAAWQGWGTALKPAAEHWILARKPLAGTVAANVLEHGTGGLNIDGCRVPHASEADFAKHAKSVARLKERGGTMQNNWKNCSDLSGANDANTAGRWPANVTLDEEAASVVGEPSRFFYIAKAPKSDKTANGTVENNHPTVKNTALMRWLVRLITPPGGTILDPFMGSGSTGVAALKEGFHFIGIEQDDAFFQIARARIKQETKIPDCDEDQRGTKARHKGG